MVTALQTQGHDVAVWSKPHEAGFGRLDAELSAYRPEVVILAYVPLGFAPHSGGISPALVLWCARLTRRTNASTLLLAHEVSLPVAAHWRRRELKLALLGAAQVAQFQLLARAFDSIAFSNEGSRDLLRGLLAGSPHRLHTLRISSSIPIATSADPRAELSALGYTLPKKAVLFFGTGHGSVLFDYVEAALSALLQVDPDVQLVIVGMDAAKLRRRCPALSDFGSRVQALGFVPARAVSLWLHVAELVLAPLAEGVNARKTTVMAGLQHGRAVVTTKGFHTRDDIPWARICGLAPLDRAAFAALAVRCYQDPAWRAQLGAAGRSDYEANASASVTAAQLLAFAARRGAAPS
jgi:glycosyltransferase involved in cell wall biosynthesis